MRIPDQITSITQMLRLPTHCLLCQTWHRDAFAVCTLCQANLPKLGPACTRCATPVLDESLLICGPCGMNKPLVDRVFTAYRFDEPLRTILHEFKYREGLYLSAFLAKLMLEALPSTYDTQCLIPVPMHPTSIRQRGFNQAALLAQHLSRHLKRPINQTHCKKIIHTPHQAGLDAKARRQNLRNAFEIQPLPYQHVTLIDDLLTTGSTVNELTQQMKRAGVTQVDVICCAKACTP